MGSTGTATVWDIPADASVRAAEAMREVGLVLAVADGDSDVALADLACELLARRHRRVLLAACRCVDPTPWTRCAHACLPDSRVAARLMQRGRMPPGSLSAQLERLAVELEAAG
jgi:hypothetical protein